MLYYVTLYYVISYHTNISLCQVIGQNLLENALEGTARDPGCAPSPKPLNQGKLSEDTVNYGVSG